MIGWIWRVLVGRFSMPPLCAHKWAVRATFRLTRRKPDGTELPSGESYVLRCSDCGEMKNHDA